MPTPKSLTEDRSLQLNYGYCNECGKPFAVGDALLPVVVAAESHSVRVRFVHATVCEAPAPEAPRSPVRRR